MIFHKVAAANTENEGTARQSNGEINGKLCHFALELITKRFKKVLTVISLYCQEIFQVIRNNFTSISPFWLSHLF